MKRFLAALRNLPVVAVDLMVARIRLAQTQQSVFVTEANLNVARTAEILLARGEREAGRELLASVIRALIPKPVKVETPVSTFPPLKSTDKAFAAEGGDKSAPLSTLPSRRTDA